ncbi:hypothetical protein THASP1DRAFT_25969 [Thamnocephalis sphaerospora]|uniref:Methionine synthase reductase n=1 Tax=Thamnocephalis sphaerospora TaxID=78915 RepID=A0A4P9XIL7_9FUNG|nr:hypothetical protein THASP1DRAFT_25969 [Thamnocephalis sphaerospora]|eukprot:RKP05552.1 hypothetical protein THASP1DRAFT_25969 [Thamnocephalis sphaerospora]
MASVDERADRLVIFYASQTGNAEWIAKSLDKSAAERGYQCRCLAMDDHAEVELEQERVLAFVVSTTGDGDPPDNSLKFWRWLRRNKQSDLLQHTQYAILGLGDTNYDNFCNTAKRLEKRLQEKAARPFYPTGRADDATGLEEVVDPWIDNLWPALAAVCKSSRETAQSVSAVDQLLDNTMAAETAEPAAQVVASDKLADGIKDVHIAEPVPEVKKPTAGETAAASGAYPAYVLDLDTSALDQGLSQLSNLAKSPVDLCEVVALPADANVSAVRKLPPVFFNTPTPLLYARIKTARTLTQPEAVKRTLHLELEMLQRPEADSPLIADELDVLPGDSFGIICENDPGLVQAILEQLDCVDTADQPVRVQSLVDENGIAASLGQTTVRELLTHALDLQGTLRKSTIRLLADVSQDLRDQHPTLLDLLVTFPSARPPIGRLLGALSALQPRSYSCTNTPLLHPRELHCAFNIAEYVDAHGRQRHGVCTPWLDRISRPWQGATSTLAASPILRVYLRPNVTNFRVPDAAIHHPMILIGPGTGVAPFIGFLAHRSEQRRLRLSMGGISRVPSRAVDALFGPIQLYYGCRDDRLDFLYRDEIMRAQNDRTLSELVLACSRKPEHGRRYVQDGLYERGADVWRIMSAENGIIFVCGDATGMARDVNTALAEIVQQHGGAADMKEALATLAEWTQQGRYLRDLRSDTRHK